MPISKLLSYRSFLISVFLLLLSDSRAQMQSDWTISNTANQPSQLFRWIHNGDLYLIDKTDGSTSFYAYRFRDRRMIVLNNRSALESVVAQEILGPANTGDFVLGQLPFVLNELFGPKGAEIVTEAFIQGRNALPQYAWGNVDQKEVLRSNVNLVQYLRNAALPPGKESWERIFCTANLDGSIDEWRVAGQLAPCFTMQVMRRKTIATRGSIVVPLPAPGERR